MKIQKIQVEGMLGTREAKYATPLSITTLVEEGTEYVVISSPVMNYGSVIIPRLHIKFFIAMLEKFQE